MALSGLNKTATLVVSLSLHIPWKSLTPSGWVSFYNADADSDSVIEQLEKGWPSLSPLLLLDV